MKTIKQYFKQIKKITVWEWVYIIGLDFTAVVCFMSKTSRWFQLGMYIVLLFILADLCSRDEK